MTSIIKRFTYIDKSTKINLLIYPFLLATLSYGVGFVVFGWSDFVHASSLYASMALLHPWLPIIWGIAALIAVSLVILLIMTRKGFWYGDTAALLGMMCWLFGGLCYALTGGWLLVFSVAMPNLLFWIWYYFRLSYFKRYGIPDVDVDTVLR